MTAPRPPDVPIGPRSQSQRYIESLLAQVRSLEQSARQYADSVNAIELENVTAEVLAEWKSVIEDWYWSQRRAAQIVYDIATDLLKAEQALAMMDKIIAADTQKAEAPPLFMPPPEELRIPMDD